MNTDVLVKQVKCHTRVVKVESVTIRNLFRFMETYQNKNLVRRLDVSQ